MQSPRIGHVRLNNAHFHGYHGVTAAERKRGGHYEVDVDVTTDISRAARTDQIRHAINYERIHAVVRSFLEEKRFKLLETLAVHLVDSLMTEFPAALEVAVRVRKLRPPIEGIVGSSEVIVSMPRSEWRKLR